MNECHFMTEGCVCARVCVFLGRQIGMLGTDRLELCIYCEMVPGKVVPGGNSHQQQPNQCARVRARVCLT